MLALQEEKYIKFIAELLAQQQTNLKQEIQTMGDKYKQQILSMETAIRQKDTKIELLETQLTEQKEHKDGPGTNINKEVDNQKTADEQHDPLFHHWPGQSPGPDVLQNKIGAQNKEIPMHATIRTPGKEWSELVEDTIKD